MRETTKGLGLRTRDWVYRLPAPPVFRGIAELIYRSFLSFSRNDGSHMAAGVAYYAIFSLFPLALAAIAVGGLFVTPEQIEGRVIGFFEELLPGLGQREIIRGNIETLVQARGALGAVAIAALLWSGRAVFGALHRVMNRAWGVVEAPHFLLYQIGQIAGAVAVAVLFMLSAALGTVGRVIVTQTDLLLNGRFSVDAVVTLLPFMVSLLLFLVVYKVLPDAAVRWRDAALAAVVAAVLLELSKILFAYYLSNLSTLDLVYGSVTTIVVLMLFLYVVSMVVVLGAELSSEYNRLSRAGLMVFRGHMRPVRGGLAPPEWREARGSIR